MIKDTELKKLFGSPKIGRILAHRTIRRRLGVSNTVACGILASAIDRGIIYRASGLDVGYNGLRKRFYGLSRNNEV